MDQVSFLQAARLTTFGAVIAALCCIAGCDPSPASQAIKQRPLSSPPAELATQEPDNTAAEAPIDTANDHQLGLEDQPAAMSSMEKSAALADFSEVAEVEKRASNPEEAPGEGDLELLGHTIPAGSSRRLTWSASEVFEGVSTTTPVLVVNGTEAGPTVCLTAAIHGDELNGIEMVRRVMHELEPKKLNGAVIGVPIVNLQGFRRGSRYLPDRRDLNRYFPGNPQGSSASRIAHSFFENIIRRCDTLVDLHTGSFYRTNLPQLRADLRHRSIREVTQGFGGMVVLHSEPALGTLRRAATDAAIPTVTLEAGEPLRLQSDKVAEGVTGIFSLLASLDMVKRVQLLGQADPVIYHANWIRADHGGILFSVARLGQVVEPGDVLGTVTDPITNEQNLIYAVNEGRVLGMALNQVVMPGFAAFRIGVEADGPPPDTIFAADWGPRQSDSGEEEASERDAANGSEESGSEEITAETEETS